jgi:uncharacterized protein YndB with AHSA1/START domain
MTTTHTVTIDRKPEDVFAYLDELSRHGEWQDDIVSIRVETDGPTKVGTRATEMRRIGGRVQAVSYEITRHDPPHSFAFRGIGGPIRPVAQGTITPIDDGSRTEFTLEFDLTGHGLGKLLLPIARSQANKGIPIAHQRLKERLEENRA